MGRRPRPSLNWSRPRRSRPRTTLGRGSPSAASAQRRSAEANLFPHLLFKTLDHVLILRGATQEDGDLRVQEYQGPDWIFQSAADEGTQRRVQPKITVGGEHQDVEPILAQHPIPVWFARQHRLDGLADE